MLQPRDAERSSLLCATNLPDQPMEQAMGSRLKTFFDGAITGPIPDRMQQLGKALEDALDRGDIRQHDSSGARPSRF
jgi:hypothetical protein